MPCTVDDVDNSAVQTAGLRAPCSAVFVPCCPQGILCLPSHSEHSKQQMPAPCASALASAALADAAVADAAVADAASCLSADCNGYITVVSRPQLGVRPVINNVSSMVR